MDAVIPVPSANSITTPADLGSDAAVQVGPGVLARSRSTGRREDLERARRWTTPGRNAGAVDGCGPIGVDLGETLGGVPAGPAIDEHEAAASPSVGEEQLGLSAERVAQAGRALLLERSDQALVEGPERLALIGPLDLRDAGDRQRRFLGATARAQQQARGEDQRPSADHRGAQPPAGPPPRPGSVMAAGSSSRSTSSAAMPRSSASSRIVRPVRNASLASFAASS